MKNIIYFIFLLIFFNSFSQEIERGLLDNYRYVIFKNQESNHSKTQSLVESAFKSIGFIIVNNNKAPFLKKYNPQPSWIFLPVCKFLILFFVTFILYISIYSLIAFLLCAAYLRHRAYPDEIQDFCPFDGVYTV